jgi:hypothetical protein
MYLMASPASWSTFPWGVRETSLRLDTSRQFAAAQQVVGY